jgi:two-component system, chemotaxis family, protein-glutamate methylesterase/glutaminase
VPSAPVSVLLIDDSLIALTILSRMLSTSPDIQVVGKARSGREALELIPRLQPAVICTDLNMPDMDGLQLTKEIMERFPRPILVVSAAVHPEDAHNVFRLLEAGAIDVLPKPRGGLAADEQGVAQELIRKIKIISGVVALTRRQKIVSGLTPLQTGPSSPPRQLAPASSPSARQPGAHRHCGLSSRNCRPISRRPFCVCSISVTGF